MNHAQSRGLNRRLSSVLDMNTMAERFQQALDARGLTPPDVIRMTKLSKGTIYNVLNGTTSPEKIWGATAKKICNYLRISSDWLLTGKGSMDDAEPGEEQDWTTVTATAQGVSLGGGLTPDEYADTHNLKFRTSSLQRQGLKPQNLMVYYGKGDSMEPRIKDGDAILVDSSETRIRNNHIYFIRYDGHFFAKRLQKHGDVVLIVSDNQANPDWKMPVVVQPSDDFEVLGKVRWIAGWEG